MYGSNETHFASKKRVFNPVGVFFFNPIQTGSSASLTRSSPVPNPSCLIPSSSGRFFGTTIMDALDYNRRLHFVSPSDEVPRGGLFRPTSQNLLPSREGATTKSALAGGARRVMVDSSKKRGVSEKPTPSKNLERGNYMKPTEAFK